MQAHASIFHLTHLGRVTQICVSKLTIIGSDNGLTPGRRKASIRTNAGIMLIRPLGTNFSEILIEIITFAFKKMRLKVSSGKWRPFCLGLNVLNDYDYDILIYILTDVCMFSSCEIKNGHTFYFAVVSEGQRTREVVVIELKTSQLEAARMVIDEVQNGTYTALPQFNALW